MDFHKKNISETMKNMNNMEWFEWQLCTDINHGMMLQIKKNDKIKGLKEE